jgi:hypothetical protein
MAARNHGVKDEPNPPSPNKKQPLKKEQHPSPAKKSAVKSPAKQE